MPANDPVKVIQRTFFDRPKVIAAIGRKNAAVLARTGGFARTTMKRGMRRRKTVSAPGDYPHAHANSLLRDLIFFGFDDAKRSVAVGPVLITPDSSIVSGTRIVPRLVNEGGVIRRRVRRRSRSGQAVVNTTSVEAQRYRPRPFVNLTAPKAAKALADNMARMDFK